MNKKDAIRYINTINEYIFFKNMYDFTSEHYHRDISLNCTEMASRRLSNINLSKAKIDELSPKIEEIKSITENGSSILL